MRLESALVNRLLDLAVELQQIPAPTFAEGRRADFMHALFCEEGLSDVSADETGNVYARLPGAGLAPPVVVSAHCDSVFPIETPLEVVRNPEKIFGPGIGDNALGLAGLMGLLWAVRGQGISLAGDLWFVANVGEEGLGDLRGMRAVVERFGRLPLAYVVLEGLALGQVYHRGLGVRRHRITVQTPGGHSWVNHGQPSAVHELTAFTNRLLALPMAKHPRTTLNVGVIAGGTSINSIAAEAHLELDLRSEDIHALENLATRVETMAVQSNRQDVTFRAQVIGQRPVGELPQQHPLVRLAKRSLEAVGIHPCLNIGSTDANLPLSLGLPAICIGLSTGGGAHTSHEYILTYPVAQGLRQLVAVVEGVYAVNFEDIP